MEDILDLVVGNVAQAGSHSAAGQMTGYLYQCELALLELADRSYMEPEAQLRMEVLDDIEFLHGPGVTPVELLQSKHRRDAGLLSETGKDFWRSVASWIDALKELGDPGPERMPLLRLVTTQTASPGSFLYLLREGTERNVAQALTRMEKVAKADGPANTTTDRKYFLTLSPAHRYQLLDATVICDGAPVMSDLDSRLARTMGIRSGQHRDQILDQIKGWWYRVSVELLDRKSNTLPVRASVTGQELLCRLEEITAQYAMKNLPITEALRDLTDAEVAAYEDRLVVQQMRWIGLNRRMTATYLRDFHRAFAQRSEWIRTFQITEEKLGEYEHLLWDEWDHVFNFHADPDDDCPEAEAQAIGKQVLKETMDKVADKPARPGSITESWIGRGTMHSLADRAATSNKPVGWHPRYDSHCKNHPALSTPDLTDQQGQ
ncbi:ABC-three component system protein [Streptomyces sp. NPDC097617]|uniref:ABC-three component system protein n=1 Tax=Streptomyces sp. NPDC097617 TaxID=3366091 RepID=UPI0038055606